MMYGTHYFVRNNMSEIIQDAKKLFEAYKLKFTYRFTDRPMYK